MKSPLPVLGRGNFVQEGWRRLSSSAWPKTGPRLRARRVKRQIRYLGSDMGVTYKIERPVPSSLAQFEDVLLKNVAVFLFRWIEAAGEEIEVFSFLLDQPEDGA